MFRPVHLLFLCIYCFSSSSVQAQQYSSWAINEGVNLPTQEVYQMLQDRNGYLWIATDFGLYRYNGKAFKAYQNPRYGKISVSGLVEDSKGTIWCHTFKGQILYTLNDSLAEFSVPKYIKNKNFIKFILDKSDNVWVKSETGAHQYTLSTQQWTNHQPWASTNMPPIVQELIYDKQGRLWALSYSIMACYENQKWTIYRDLTKNIPSYSTLLFIDGQDYLLSAFQGQNNLYRIQAPDKFVAVPLTPKWQKTTIYGLFKDSEDINWLLTVQGAHAIGADLKPHLNRNLLLPNQAVSSMLQDHEGNYWLSTLQDGIYVFSNLSISQSTPLNSNLSSAQLTCLAQDDATGKIYIGHYNGSLDEYTPRTGRYRRIDDGESKNIEAIFIDKERNRLWAAKGDLRYTTIGDNKWNSTYLGGGKNLVNLPQGNIAYSSFGLFRIFNPLGGPLFIDEHKYGGDFQPKIYEKHLPVITLGRQRTRMALWDQSHSNLWVAYGSETLVYTDKGEIWHPKSIKHTPLTALRLTQTDDGIMWASVHNDGIYGFKDTTLIAHIPKENMPLGTLVRAFKAKNTSLWVANEYGLCIYDTQTKLWDLIDKSDGLPTNHINDIAFLGDSVYLATNKGLVSMPLTGHYHNTTPPVIFLSQVEVDNRDTSLATSYDLSWRHHAFVFSFDVLSYKSKGLYVLEYRLAGLNNTWIALPVGDNKISFASLPTGTFKLEVRARNEDGIYSQQTLQIDLNINPPFWQHWYFFMGIFLILSYIGYRIYAFRLNELRRKHSLESELRNSKLSALKAQMNPHFIFNSLNSIQEFVLLNDKKSANSYLSKFASLMRLTLDHSNQDSIPLEEEVSLLRLYLDLEKMRFEESIEVEFVTDARILPMGIYIPSMIIQPFIENAFKHGLLHKEKGDKRLIVKMENQPDNLLKVVIEDNGIGRRKTALIQTNRHEKHGSFSTGAAQTRLELLNQRLSRKIAVFYEDLEDENGEDSGTRVTLSIPYKIDNQNER